jgi:hypothetical protein
MYNKEFDEALQRLELLNDELDRIRHALNASAQGVPFNESWNENVYLEEVDAKTKCYSKLAVAIEHLFKLAYCNSEIVFNRNKIKWRDEIVEHIDDVIDITEWNRNKPKANYVKYLKDNFNEIYNTGIANYKKDSKTYKDLRVGLELIPDECPWNLYDLMENTIEELISVLPNIINNHYEYLEEE